MECQSTPLATLGCSQPRPTSYVGGSGRLRHALHMARHSEVAASGFSATAAAAQAYDSRRWLKSLVFEAWLLPQNRHARVAPDDARGARHKGSHRQKGVSTPSNE